MWAVYRKLFLPAQAFVVVAALTAYFAAGRDWIVALIILGVMQIGVLAGAASIHSRATKPPRPVDDPLPLQRRR